MLSLVGNPKQRWNISETTTPSKQLMSSDIYCLRWCRICSIIHERSYLRDSTRVIVGLYHHIPLLPISETQLQLTTDLQKLCLGVQGSLLIASHKLCLSRGPGDDQVNNSMSTLLMDISHWFNVLWPPSGETRFQSRGTGHR